MAAALVVLKKAAIVDLNKGNLDKAVEKLQKLVRISVASGSTDVISTVPLWLLLGEAYKQKGNYPSAIRVFRNVLDIESNVPSRLQLIGLYRLVGKFNESIEEARLLKADNNCPENLKQFYHLNYAYSLVLCAQNVPTVEEKLLLMEELFGLFEILLGFGESIMLQKTFAISLEIVLKMDPSIFPELSKRLNLPTFDINNRLQLVEKRITALTTILNKNLIFSDSWSDLALALGDKFALTGDESTFNKAEQFLKRAILLPSSAQKRSNYWFNLGTLQVDHLRLAKASHCFIRALQLNDQNAKAWYALSLVYRKADKLGDAFHALKNAQQLDPDLIMEA